MIKVFGNIFGKSSVLRRSILLSEINIYDFTGISGSLIYFEPDRASSTIHIQKIYIPKRDSTPNERDSTPNERDSTPNERDSTPNERST